MRKYFTSAVFALFAFTFVVSSCTSDGSADDTNSVARPEIITTAASLINQTTATSGGVLVSAGGGTVFARGICYATEPNPTIEDMKVSNPGNVGTFVCKLSGLAAGTQYFVRAFATNIAGTSYGQEISFTTTTNAIVLPVVTTSDASEITQTTATSGGNVVSAGGTDILSRGICWSTTENPTLLNNVVESTGTTGVFSSAIIGLNPGTVYFVRAYATNSVGTSYGNQITLTTLTEAGTGLPVINTSEAIDITDTSAISGGDVTSTGGSPITARGICWSTSENPTTADNVIPDSGTSGPFTSTMTGLSSGTLYFVKAFATNASGTSYGEEVVFTTL